MSKILIESAIYGDSMSHVDALKFGIASAGYDARQIHWLSDTEAVLTIERQKHSVRFSNGQWIQA